MTDARDDNTVGYGRTPPRTRFQPGQSGNPAGRPKRRPNFQETVLADLASPMPGTDQKRAGSKLQALARTLVDAAIAGDARAQSLLVGVLMRIGDAKEHETAALTSDDRAILDAYVGAELKRRANENDAVPAPAEDGAK